MRASSAQRGLHRYVARHPILLWNPNGKNADDVIAGPNKRMLTRLIWCACQLRDGVAMVVQIWLFCGTEAGQLKSQLSLTLGLANRQMFPDSPDGFTHAAPP